MCSSRFPPILMMLLLAWILVSTTSTTTAAEAGTSTKLLNFMDLFSRDWDNQWELDEDEKNGRPPHNHIRILHVPAKIPALHSDNTFMGFEMVDNEVKRLHVMVTTEESDGEIKVVRYNITNTNKFSVNSVDPIDFDGLLNLTPEDLVESEECDSTFSQIEPNVFYGLWPDCRDQHSQTIPVYQMVFTCSAVSLFTQPGDLERPNTVPYIIRSQRRFPLLPEMLAGVPDYSRPCPEN